MTPCPLWCEPSLCTADKTVAHPCHRSAVRRTGSHRNTIRLWLVQLVGEDTPSIAVQQGDASTAAYLPLSGVLRLASDLQGLVTQARMPAATGS